MFRLIARMMVKRTLRAHLNRDVEAILKTYSRTSASVSRATTRGRASSAASIRCGRGYSASTESASRSKRTRTSSVGGRGTPKGPRNFTEHPKAPEGPRLREQRPFMPQEQGGEGPTEGGWGEQKESI